MENAKTTVKLVVYVGWVTEHVVTFVCI